MNLLNKFNRKLIVTLFIILFINANAFANPEVSLQALRNLEKKVVVKTLANGLKVIIYPRGAAPVFGAVTIVGAGGVDEFPGETGISHMLEHMAFKGTKFFGTKDVKKETEILDKIEELARKTKSGNEFTKEQKKEWQDLHSELAKLTDSTQLDREFKLRGEVGLNASTGNELTTYYVSMPKNAFEFWAWIESERILNPIMREFYKERDVVLEERRMRLEDSPENKLYDQMMRVVFEKHAYRNPVIGYAEDIGYLTAKQTADFQKRFYVPQNMVVAIAGDVNSNEDFELIKKYFERIPKGPDPVRPSEVEPEQLAERTTKLKLNAEPINLIAYKKPNYPHPDDPALTLMQYLLAGSKISPMYKKLVLEKKMLSMLDVFEAPGSKYPNIILFHLVNKKPHSNAEVLKEFDLVIEEFKKSEISLAQLDIAKRSLAMEFLSPLSSNIEIAKTLATSQLIYGTWNESLKWLELMLQVKPEDIKRVTKKYLVKNSRTIASIEKIE
jgi:predicted Zn-dependent peptidase